MQSIVKLFFQNVVLNIRMHCESWILGNLQYTVRFILFLDHEMAIKMY